MIRKINYFQLRNSTQLIMLATPKPIHRSKLRTWLGKRYFIFRRYISWYFGDTKFAKKQSEESLPVEIFTHQSILLRKLKDVEMYLQHNKIKNLEIASRHLHNLIIEPGEVFSFWYLVGKTTKRKGYQTGMMLHNGKVVRGTGGGLCQLGNLIFWMALHTPLTVVERWRHSYDVFPDSNRTLPFGSGATLSYNYVDLQLKNNTNQPYQLQIWLSEKYLHGAFFAQKAINHFYKIEEKNHLIRGESWGGYTRHNQIIQQVFNKKTEELVTEKLVTENHAVMMYTPFLTSENQAT